MNGESRHAARTLILVKHSLPQIEPDAPAHQWQLSEKGRELCSSLADALAVYEPGRIFCSREPKARETAQIVAERLGIACQEADGLHEHDRSNVPLLPKHVFEQSVQETFRQPDRLVFGLETGRQALRRFSDAVDRVLTMAQEPCVAVVAHGTVISLFAGEPSEVGPFDLWRQLGLPSFVVLSMSSRQVQQIVTGIT